MAPVARELAKSMGVLEPLQSKDSLAGQIDELIQQLALNTSRPLTLIGSSWGAVLALFVAARREDLINKLILIGSAVFDAETSQSTKDRRRERLTVQQRQRHDELLGEMVHSEGETKDRLFAEWANLFFNTDVYDPLTRDLETIEAQPEVNDKVWSDFKVLRDTPGFLESEFAKIRMPVVVIHGEYDPHPIEGIRPFLRSVLLDVKFHILSNCGHYPWIERRARDQFFQLLLGEIPPYFPPPAART